jgi:competence protein ComEC
MQTWWRYLFITLALIIAGLWLAVFSLPDKNLHLVACDVGQGDATLIVYGTSQVLIDGGPNNKVLDCLGKHVPFWDRKIEVVILTHPDSDHYTGLIEVIKRYKVDNYLNNGLESGNQSYQVLRKEVGGGGLREVIAKKGTGVRVGKMSLDTVSPEEAKKEAESNDNSLVIDLKYGNFEALLTGDAPKGILNAISVNKPLDYLKLSHHGSKTGTDAFTLDNFMPKLAIISVGKNNYGHPDDGVIKILRDKDIKILRTDEAGDIEIVSDGKVFNVVE